MSKWREYCRELQDDGVQIELINTDGSSACCAGKKLNFKAMPENYRIPVQPIPEGLGDWRDWCEEWCAAGLMFEEMDKPAGLEKFISDHNTFPAPIYAYRIAAQSIPAEWINEE